MCAAVSAYVHACSAVGIHLSGWRSTICGKRLDFFFHWIVAKVELSHSLTSSSAPSGKFSSSCPKGTIHGYNMTSCNRTCQSLSQTDYSCQTTFTPVDGCGCAEGTYMNEDKECVPQEQCYCYHEDTVIRAGEAFHKDGHTW